MPPRVISWRLELAADRHEPRDLQLAPGRLLERAGDCPVAEVGSGEERRPERSVDLEVRERIIESERESARGVEARVELADRACDGEQIEDRDPEGGGLVLQRQGRSA